MLQCRQKLWPQQPVKGDSDKDDIGEKEKSEWKRMVTERKQKLMESFANQREQFMKKNIDATGKYLQYSFAINSN